MSKLGADRLIVAADFDPEKYGGRRGAKRKVIELANDLAGTGVSIKLNSVLRANGYDLVDEIHSYNLKVVADLKLVDIPNTLKYDGAFIREAGIDTVTVMGCAGIESLKALKKSLGDSCEILGVTILTSFDTDECVEIFACPPEEGVLKFTRIIKKAGLDGLILSGRETRLVREFEEFDSLYLNTPGIRPACVITKNDDQKRIVTPAEAIKNGADRIIIGRPIVEAEDPRQVVLAAIEEIEENLEQRGEE